MNEGLLEEDFQEIIAETNNRDTTTWRYYNPKFEYEEILQDFASPWVVHKRFAYDLVRNFKPNTIIELGTHWGTSFCSFCQGVKDANYNASLYAVDTWRGESHSGYHGDDMYYKFRKIKENVYPGIEIKLLRKTSDEVLDLFENDSIDLLHIDLNHTCEVVKNNFETWFPKVKMGGVILLHDIFINRDDFGVCKLWEELKKNYKTIELYHSYGLGVLFKHDSKYIDWLRYKREWRIRYSYIAENIKNQILTASSNNLKATMVNCDSKVNSLLDQLNEVQTTLNSRSQQISELKQALCERFSQMGALAKSISEAHSVADLQDLEILELKHTLTVRDRHISELYLSTSWRATRPIRFLGHQFKKFKLIWEQLKKKKHVSNQNEILSPKTQNPLFFFTPDVNIPTLKTKTPIDVIIPVYNGLAYLKALLSSITRNTSKAPYRIIIVDDCSSDKRILFYIDSFINNHPEIPILLIKNDSNMGYARSVNVALKIVKNHFILLNTDVEVPDFWIERLMYPIFEMEKVASTTPFTNSGTLCSFPEYLEDNEMYEGLKVDELDSYFKYVKFIETYIEIPTGIGFCMGVNKDLVDKIGMFNDIFGNGYGEENDWCQRAIKIGYRNIHVTNLFTFHKHGGSFDKQEKEKLQKENIEKIIDHHPDYMVQVSNTIKKNELKYLRRAIELKILSKKYPAVLVINHDLGGGATDYLDRRIVDDYLPAHNLVLSVRYMHNKRKYVLSACHMNKGWMSGWLFEDIEDLGRIIKEFAVKSVFINELVSYPDVLGILDVIIKLKKKQKFDLVVPVHDYFCICGSYTLLDGQEIFCGIPEHKKCAICWSSNSKIKNVTNVSSVVEWREKWGDLLSLADKILCFSKSSISIINKAYPHVGCANIVFVPHKVDYIPKITESTTKIKIGVIGAIGPHKGLNIIKEMAELIESKSLQMEIVIVGYTAENIESSNVRITGSFDRSELSSLISQNKIDIILIPSICPETFSYTTEEAICMGLPVAVFDLGAPAERVSEYDKGIIIKEISAQSALDAIIEWESLQNVGKKNAELNN